MRVYFSHAIRGQVGPRASHDTQSSNCKAAKDMAQQVSRLLASEGGRYAVDFYIPADHEDFVQIGYDEKIISEETILKIDCLIIGERCDACIVYVPSWDELQGGRRVEWRYCIENGVPVIIFSRATQAVNFLKELADGKS